MRIKLPRRVVIYKTILTPSPTQGAGNEMGRRDRRRIRLHATRRKALHHPEPRAHGHGRHLDPLVLCYSAEERAVRFLNSPSPEGLPLHKTPNPIPNIPHKC